MLNDLMPSKFHILLVEDSRTDVKIIERALREGGVEHRLTAIPDGCQALDYLLQLQHTAEPEGQEPDLILLDLDLPGIEGCQVLSAIKGDPFLRTIPVVVLTNSHRAEDVLRTYQVGANTSIRKPSEYPRYRDLVATLRRYWQEAAPRPPHDRPRP